MVLVVSSNRYVKMHLLLYITHQIREPVAVVGQRLCPFAPELVYGTTECGGRRGTGYRLCPTLRTDHLDAAVLHGET